MTDARVQVLVLNFGSSTLKWTLLNGRDRATIRCGEEQWSAQEGDGGASRLAATLRAAAGFDAVGHRVVHGGGRFHEAVVIDPQVRQALAALQDLDPLHMPPALAGIDAVSREFPGIPQVAAFDTAFHATLSPAAAGYALPYEWSERWGLRRFGFHGLSVAWSVSRARELLGGLPPRLIVCHLGSGCSLTAVAAGRSIDTTMGFSPLEGVMMATRSGSVDPALLLYLQEHCGLGRKELLDTLEQRSGLLGVSGIAADLRRVLKAADAGEARARLAYDEFIWTLKRAVGSMAAVLGGVDAVVFTGGIGENSARVRAEVCAALKFAGLTLEDESALPASGDRRISVPQSTVAALVVHAREDLVILDEVLRLTQSRQ
jgi:acetate kinase